jgi:hypothetical protein
MDNEIQHNHISIFKELAIDKVNSKVNELIFNGLLSEFYNEFIDMCNYVEINKNIKSVSCFIKDNKINFIYNDYIET